MEYNIYCDESCHLEHDGESAMVIGGISCLKSERNKIRNNIIKIKKLYNIPKFAEIKWNKVSTCNIEYFKSIVNYFFTERALTFRAVIIDKSKLKHSNFNQTHDEFYYKMYYQCLIGLIETREANYIYLDKKDTKGTFRIEKLKFYLSRKTHDFDENIVKRIQCVNSFELPILQLTDLFIGAIGYINRDIKKSSPSKLELINHIVMKSGYSLQKSTILAERKFNLFFIDLQ